MVTFNGVQVPEADVLKAAAEIQQRAERKPVEGVEYVGGDNLKRRWRGVRWEYRETITGAWRPSSSGDIFWRTGQLRPITPTPWTPTGGEWVQHTTEPWDKVRRVTDTIGKSVRVNGAFALQAINNLRPATPDEIAAAKRIELVDRLIVRYKLSGSVWQYWQRESCWVRQDGARLNASECALHLSNLDLDHYDILPEYTVQGAQR